jgi:hypothetical protein
MTSPVQDIKFVDYIKEKSIYSQKSTQRSKTLKNVFFVELHLISDLNLVYVLSFTPLCRVFIFIFIFIYLKQTMFLGYIVLQLFYSYNLWHM